MTLAQVLKKIAATSLLNVTSFLPPSLRDDRTRQNHACRTIPTPAPHKPKSFVSFLLSPGQSRLKPELDALYLPARFCAVSSRKRCLSTV